MINQSAKKNLIKLLVPVLIIAVLVLTFALFTKNTSRSDSVISEEYPLLSKRIFADSPNDVIINFVPLRKSIEQKLANANTQASFYFEYLPSGTSIRIGSNDELVAASLIKLPLVMNLYKAAELKKLNLDAIVTVQENDLDSAYGELWKKGPGYKLSLREAAHLMLTESDNTATHVVFNKLRGVLSEEEQSLNQLDVEQNLKNGQAIINSESYGSVLRSLYLSSYLSKDSSEEILVSLTKSEETRRLTALLPKDVKVAHKNGVYNALWSESDCGIVYVPKRPYILCIMVGLPEEKANELIASLSKEIYDYIVEQ